MCQSAERPSAVKMPTRFGDEAQGVDGAAALDGEIFVDHVQLGQARAVFDGCVDARRAHLDGSDASRTGLEEQRDGRVVAVKVVRLED
jgi:hypothetical protein